MANIGWLELLIIVAVLAVLFTIPKRLPQLARSLGKSIRGFKKGLKEEADESNCTVAEVEKSAAVKGVLPGEKRSGETSPGAAAKKKTK